MSTFRLTQSGLDKFKTELDKLSLRRPQIIRMIAAAREQGDLSENSEYQIAKEEQAILDTRIRELKNILKNAVLIDKSQPRKEVKVELGSTVRLKDVKTDQAVVFNIVGTMEADPFENKISDESLLGSQLIDKAVGDVVSLSNTETPLSYKILAID